MIRGLLVLLLLWSSWQPLAWGQNLNTLQQQFREAERLQLVQQQRIQSLNQELQQLDGATQENLRRLRTLEGQVTRLEQERAELSRQIRSLEQDIKRAEGRIASLEAQLEALKERLSTLMVSLHKERAGRYLPILRAQSFSDLAVRTRWVGYLGQQQTNLVEQIQTTLSAVQDERSRLLLLVQDLNKKQAEREQRLEQLSAQRGEFNQVIALLQARREGRQALLRESLNAQANARQELDRLTTAIALEQARLERERREQAERERLERERRERELAAQRQREEEARRQREAAARNNVPEPIRPAPAPPPPPPPPPPAQTELPSELTGELLFPLAGGRIIGAYGQNGNDYQELRGPIVGSPVRMAADGRLIYALFTANLGWLVLVQHTNRLFTYYINVQNLQVEVGSDVRQGQLLGYTGGGALIPPDVLWFRVAISGPGGLRYVDPSGYY